MHRYCLHGAGSIAAEIRQAVKPRHCLPPERALAGADAAGYRQHETTTALLIKEKRILLTGTEPLPVCHKPHCDFDNHGGDLLWVRRDHL